MSIAQAGQGIEFRGFLIQSVERSELPNGVLPGEVGSDPLVDIRRFFVASVPANPAQRNLAGQDIPDGFPELDPR